MGAKGSAFGKLCRFAFDVRRNRAVLFLTMASVFLAIPFSSTSLPAATLEVCPGGLPACGFATITDAVANAADGDSILIHDGTYTENLALTGRTLALSSVNGPGMTVIDGSGTTDPVNGSVLQITQGSSVTLTGLTLRGGIGSKRYGYPDRTFGGAVLVEDSTFAMDSCIVTGNTAYTGGGIFTLRSDVTVTDSTFTGNHRIHLSSSITDRGTALEGGRSTVAISGSLISGNGLVDEDDSNWGVVSLRFDAQNPYDPSMRSTLTISDTEISDNSAKGVDVFGRLVMTDSTVSRNTGRGVSASDLDVARTLISDNRGGGLFVGGVSPV